QRGEEDDVDYDSVSQAGSSPPARGRGVAVPLAGTEPGIIPASAGKRAAPPGAAGLPEDHPRQRGEEEPEFPYLKHVGGSSPPARGRVDVGAGGEHPERIIPASAGKRCSGRTPRAWHADHPRQRGEES